MKLLMLALPWFLLPAFATSPQWRRVFSGSLSVGRAARLALLAAFVSLVAQPAAHVQATGPLTTLYSFTGGTDGGGTNGAALVQGSDGSFYGTTRDGGANGCGTVFRITPAGALTTLYSFTGGTDGGGPGAALVQGNDGNFYGTTTGGTSNAGTVFEITPTGALTTLYRFTGGSDGGNPAALVQGNDGNFYGTTTGGTSNDGTVFQITPAGALTTLYSFTGGSDGYEPEAALVQGTDGSFYGTTPGGGANGRGTVFRITPAGALTTLYSFSAIDSYSDNSDGAGPGAALVQGSDGNFYGTTGYGGAEGGGTVFRITPAGTVTTLYSFSRYAGKLAGLVQGSDGNFYGTTFQGGTIFRITPAGTLTTLYSFSGSDGAYPFGALVQGSDGNFYGTTEEGGANNYGTVFKLAVSGVTGSPGSVQLSAAAASVTEASGSATLTVSRTGGRKGAVSVNYATADDSAVAGTDYQATSGALSWNDGDDSDKTITVPILNRNLASGSTQFLVNLSGPAGGATLASPTQTVVTIFDTASSADILSVALLSPPAGLTVTVNQLVDIQADVAALSNSLVNVEFYAVDGSGNTTDLGGTTSPRGEIAWVPTAAGSDTLEAVATDVQGNTQQTRVVVNVVTASAVPVTAQTALDGGLDGTTLALNDTVDVVAQAVDSQGNALASVQFYVDGVPVTTTLVDGGDGSMRRTEARAATVSAGNGTSLFYKASVPVGKPQQSLTAVGTTSGGVSAVSTAATLYGKSNAGIPPAVSLSNLNEGDTVPTGSAAQSVTVAASAGSLPIDHVELFVDNQSAGRVTTAPYTFYLPVLTAGMHSVSAKATDTSLLSKVSEPVIVKAEAAYTLPTFFSGQAALGGGAYYLAFANGNYFGYYSFLSDPHYIYHFDLGYEYVFDARDGKSGVYFYDFASSTFFYTSPVFPCPYLYDFTLNTVLYYYPDPNNPGHYNTNSYRFFYDFATNSIITK